MSESIIRLEELKDITGLSISTIWRLEKLGKFPKRRKIALRNVGWLRSEIQNWIDKGVKDE